MQVYLGESAGKTPWAARQAWLRFDYPPALGENDFKPEHPRSRLFPAYLRGPVAQLGARFHGMEEVVGSIPTRSTSFLLIEDEG